MCDTMLSVRLKSLAPVRDLRAKLHPCRQTIPKSCPAVCFAFVDSTNSDEAVTFHYLLGCEQNVPCRVSTFRSVTAAIESAKGKKKSPPPRKVFQLKRIQNKFFLPAIRQGNKRQLKIIQGKASNGKARQDISWPTKVVSK